jgi:methionine-rich copper-binding protein CopC
MIIKKEALFILIPLFFMYSAMAVVQGINLGEQNKTLNQSIIEKNSLFDILVTIPQDYQTVEAGKELLTSIKLINLGSSGRIDVILNIEIKDSAGNMLLTKKETVAVETQANFVRTFTLPSDAKLGKYSIHVKLIYADGKEAAAESSFEIVKKSTAISRMAYFILGGIIILGGLIYMGIKAKALIKKLKMKGQIRCIVKNKLKVR